MLLVDLMMPDLDGLTVCRIVKQIAPATAVIIITASGDAQIEMTAIRDGASALIPKHLAAAKLKQTVLQLYASRQSEREE